MNPSEALYGFAAWLTTRDDPITLSSTSSANPAADAVYAFIKANKLPKITKKYPNNIIFPNG